MNPEPDYKTLLTDVIKKQIVILGPDITLVKARNVKGITVSEDGTVTEVSGNPQEVIQNLIDQFVQLSGLIVKKTMEPLLAGYPNLSMAAAQTITRQIVTQQPTAPNPTPPSSPPAQNQEQASGKNSA